MSARVISAVRIYGLSFVLRFDRIPRNSYVVPTRLFQILIGNARYNCSCKVRYVSTNIWLTVGLSVGCGLLLIIIVIAIVRAVLACRRWNKNKPVEQREETGARNDYVGARRPADDFELDERNYWTIPAEVPNNCGVYCSALPDEPGNKEYAGLGEPQPQP